MPCNSDIGRVGAFGGGEITRADGRGGGVIISFLRFLLPASKSPFSRRGGGAEIWDQAIEDAKNGGICQQTAKEVSKTEQESTTARSPRFAPCPSCCHFRLPSPAPAG